MYLFELAIELGVRSADVAEAAPGLGLDGITPTSELTPDQVEALRAHFAKVPVGAGVDAPGSERSYRPTPSKPPPAPTPVPVPVAPRREFRIGRVLLVVLLVVALAGVAALAVHLTRTESAGRGRTGATGRSEDGVPTVGPDGKPLTEQQQLDLARLQAARADAVEETCAALRGLRDAEAALHAATRSEPLAQAKARTLEAAGPIVLRYDQVIAQLPDRALDTRLLQQRSRAIVAEVQAASGPTDLERRLRALSDREKADGTLAAATRFDAFAQSTCGFSVVRA